MQTSDGFSHDCGPPKGSRLAKYLGANRSNSTAPSSTSSSSSGLQFNANVPSFVPKFAQMSLNPASPSQPAHNHISHNHITQPLGPALAAGQPPYGTRNFVPTPSARNVPSDLHDQSQHHYHQQQGGTVYFYPGESNNRSHSPSAVVENGAGPESDPNVVFVNSSGNFQYHSPLPHVGKFRAKGALGNGVSQFISPDIKMELLQRQLLVELRPDPTQNPELPQQVEHLNNLLALEKLIPQASVSVFKALSVRDGVPYCIRRIHNMRIQGKQLQPLENWKKVNHVNLVQLREVIANTRAFGDSSLVLVYDYHPGAESLKTRHFGGRLGGAPPVFLDSITGMKLGGGSSTSSGSNGSQPGLQGSSTGITESQLWSYVVQLSSVLRTIHSNGLAARCIDLSKILCQGPKILLASCGVSDVMNPEHQPIQQQQMEDLHSLSRVLLALATGNAVAARRDLVQQSMQHVKSHYSSDMTNLITFLLSCGQGGSRKSINEIMPMIGARFYVQLENAQIRVDTLENELSKELENGRLFRLLCKLNTIVERPEHNMDPSWAETGDRFILKLFRDYIFHQVMESGRPWLDMSHIVHTLNKLDVGTSEKMELVSRDGENVIIVSYGDLKRCLENAFRELVTSSSVVPRH